MEVTGKHLLSSANQILKNRREGRHASKAPATSGTAQSVQDLSKAPTINTQVLRLQASLNEAQKSYSLEQARLAWLENPQGKPEDAKFGTEQLFPDFPFGKDIESYKQEVTNQIGEFARTLKGLQIEMENIFALNFETPPNLNLDADTLASVKGITSLDPSRVAKLTR